MPKHLHINHFINFFPVHWFQKQLVRDCDNFPMRTARPLTECVRVYIDIYMKKIIFIGDVPKCTRVL